MNDRSPTVAAVGGGVDLTSSGAEINAAGVERIDSHGIAQDVYVTVALRQAVRERLPFVSTCPAAINAKLSVEWKVFGVALDGDYVNRFGFVGVHVDDEAEVSGQVAADFVP